MFKEVCFGTLFHVDFIVAVLLEVVSEFISVRFKLVLAFFQVKEFAIFNVKLFFKGFKLGTRSWRQRVCLSFETDRISTCLFLLSSFVILFSHRLLHWRILLLAFLSVFRFRRSWCNRFLNCNLDFLCPLLN